MGALRLIKGPHVDLACGPINGITTVPGTVGSDEQRDYWIANLSI